jgi:cell division protein FtsI/penicillin-binding protein 2
MFRFDRHPSQRIAEPARALPAGRVWLVAVLLHVGLLTVAGRCLAVQAFQRAPLVLLASRQQVYTETLPARPGDIVDVEGRILATSVLAESLFLDPARIDQPRDVAEKLAAALGLDAAAIAEGIASNSARRFLWVKRRLSETEVRGVEALGLPPESFGFRREFLRCYPQGRLATQVIGFRDIDGDGRGGIEQSHDSVLKGVGGSRRVVRDAHGRSLTILEEDTLLPRPGRTVRLTLDTVIENYTEEVLDDVIEQWKPASACAVVMEPSTGRILAMASRPTFDPNAMHDVADDAWTNRAIADIYEPGSTLKPMIVAAALDAGVLRREEKLFCENGVYVMGRRVLHDHHPFGTLSIADVVIRSSNIGMAKVGERLGNRHMHAALSRFGFGRPTGVPLPAEESGMLLPLERWTSYSTGSVPMGQEIAVTPLQLVTAYCILANGGRAIRPRAVEDSAGNDPPVSDSVVSPETARWVCETVLRGVVEDPRGTGRRARLEYYDVFGKSGTAQKVDPATGQYSHQLHVSSFVAGGPIEDPRAVVVVLVNEPSVGGTHYGGTVAAPAAREVLRRTLLYLRVPPTQVAVSGPREKSADRSGGG